MIKVLVGITQPPRARSAGHGLDLRAVRDALLAEFSKTESDAYYVIPRTSGHNKTKTSLATVKS